jgi:hypothetical protein
MRYSCRYSTVTHPVPPPSGKVSKQSAYEKIRASMFVKGTIANQAGKRAARVRGVDIRSQEEEARSARVPSFAFPTPGKCRLFEGGVQNGSSVSLERDGPRARHY